MTREEAIQKIEGRWGIMGYCESEALGEALDMAIEALKGGDAEINEVKSPYMQHSPNGATHGRLIDADALSKKLCETTIFIKDGEVFQRMINDAPTVHADRPHGEWIEREDWNGDSYYDCSVCGESFVLCDGTPSMNLYHYCPNCGCAMDDMRGGK